MSQPMMDPTWSWNSDMSTYPKDTYGVVLTMDDGYTTEAWPLTRRVLGIHEPIAGGTGDGVLYRYAEALQHAESLRRKGKSWAIVRASQDFAEEERSNG